MRVIWSYLIAFQSTLQIEPSSTVYVPRTTPAASMTRVPRKRSDSSA
jgi:hypothetical protein